MFDLMGHRIFSWLEKRELSYWRSRMRVGKGVDLKKGLRVTKPERVTIGDHVSIGPDVILQAHAPIMIGTYTLISAGVAVVTANHGLDRRGLDMRPEVPAPVRIGRDCWIGAGALVLPGVTIGDGTVVGAGSVVSRDLPPGMICIGVPAKPVKPRPAPPDA
ncbi:MAG: DapH/DapD/GlmU-related protein [Syntrophales bacterium]|nr:DapH/DapD/GlmU-related protein [Syntrophales bacterium]HOG07545.1 DapH/DapD/GlmU-related protein [Syntrophales bacterium]HOS76889.1 DapH/DapD/GlmU-related protein [Syntrophales bacterium]HQN25597.1 DapH/DapD/GlmU-related protein [Syntrophales bacterium]HQP27990.1 DapH/DapD/GlmU-related protein [Syntrophales bacterium]